MKRKETQLEKQIKLFVTNEELIEKLNKLKETIKEKNKIKNSILQPFYDSFVSFIVNDYKKYKDQPRKERYITDNKIEFMRKYMTEVSDRVMDNYNDKLIDKETFLISMNALLDIKKDFWVL
jgi:hypothetical protein